MPFIESKYQENGFVLLIYKAAKPDPNMACPHCGRKIHHLATIYDEWSEAHASFTYYHYCKRDQIIIQRVARTDEVRHIRTTIFEQPPYELLVELLATARQQNGRNVTELTLNRQWWSPRRYPLHLGSALVVENEAVSDPITTLGEENAVEIPILPYEPPATPPRNPFTSRQASSTEAALPPNEFSPSIDAQSSIPEESTSAPVSSGTEDDEASPTRP